MKALSKVTHLVHIGYDWLRQPDFESRVSKYLESTADEAEHILNFVDEANYSLEDIELMEQNYFAEALRTCLWMQHARSLGGSSEIPEEIFMKQLQWIPKQLLVAIKEILWNDWQALAQKLPAFEEWRDTRKPLGSYLSGREDIGELELPQDIKSQLENQDDILKRIKTYEFDTILQQLQTRFWWRKHDKIVLKQSKGSEDLLQMVLRWTPLQIFTNHTKQVQNSQISLKNL